MVVNAELKPGEYDIGRISHHIIHVITRGLSTMNFGKDAGIEHESSRAASYHHSAVPQIQDKQ